MTRPQARLALATIAILASATAAIAQGPFGVATPEAGGGAFGGPLAPLFTKIAAWQAAFYEDLTTSLAGMHDRGSAFFVLAGVSFLYGVFHAAGPGHGKAVISAYLIANGETLRRGVVISFAAAFVQAAVAIALVSVAAGILKVTAVSMNAAVNVLEIGSYALIAAIGAWLLWSRLRRPGHAHAQRPAPQHDHSHDHHGHGHHEHDGGREHDHGADGADAHDHVHAPDPRAMSRPLTFSSSTAAVLSIGIRPCTGAIIILVFALAQGLYAAGIASTLVMAVGTALTVSALAGFAVLARDTAIRLAGGRSRWVGVALRTAEILAAAAVLAFGVLLLGGTLAS